jgi:hypothetical protein
MAINGWTACLKTQREIDQFTGALQCLKQKLRYQAGQTTAGFQLCINAFAQAFSDSLSGIHLSQVLDIFLPLLMWSRLSLPALPTRRCR